MKLLLDKATNREQALKAFEDGDARALVHSIPKMESIVFVFDNMLALKQRGIYEAALLQGYVWQPSAYNLPDSLLKFLFDQADREMMRAAGNPLPDGERFTVYRGVAGFAPNRRIQGWSWSLLKEKAEWFANRFGHLGDPAVYRAEVDRCEIFAYVNGSLQEQEILCNPSEYVRLTPALTMAERMLPASVRYEKWAARERAAGRNPGEVKQTVVPTVADAIAMIQKGTTLN